MKHRLLLLCMIISSTIASAQNTELNYPIDTVNGQAVYRYHVEKSIGLYRLSVNFGVSQEEIIKWNPQLRDRGLFYDELLLIPVKNATPKEEKATSQPVVQEPKKEVAEVKQAESTPAVEAKAEPTRQAETAVEPKSEEKVAAEEVKTEAKEESVASLRDNVRPSIQPIEKETLCRQETSMNAITNILGDTMPAPPEEKIYKIAVLLPLFASQPQHDASVNRFIEFYEGMMLAVNSVQKTGQKLDIYVYDTEKTDYIIRRLTETKELDNMDAILGPAYPSQVAALASYVAEKKIPTLIPFTNEVEALETNPYLMQFNPSTQQEAQAMAAYLKKHTNINCVLLDASEADIPQSIQELRSAIASANISCTHSSIHRILADSLAYDLKRNADNMIIFNTEKYANLQVLMPYLKSLKDRYNISIFSRYSWQKENIPVSQFYTTVFDAGTEMDLTDYDTMWDTYWRHEHTTSQPRYDLLGYDLMRQLIAHLEGKEYYGLQSQINFKQTNEKGGLQNTGIHVIRR